MTSAVEWLAARVPSAPEALLSEMTAAVQPFDSLFVPEALAEGASVLYRSVLSSGGERPTALPLLAADALLTHAFQAQAELEPGDLAAFALRWSGSRRLGELAR